MSDAADVAAYITRNLRSPLTLDVLSRRFGYSPRRLSQVFRRETGLTPHGYVRQERIKRAKALVQQGEKVEVAMLLVGLRNRTNFYRAFRRYAGVNPGELRGEAR